MKNLSKHIYSGNNPGYFNKIKLGEKKLISIILFILISFLYTLYKNIISSLQDLSHIFQTNKCYVDKKSSGKPATLIIVVNNCSLIGVGV